MTKVFHPMWDASMEELKKGYTENQNFCICLLCGKKFEKGIIYSEDGALYDARKATRCHIEQEHGGVFDFLLSMDKRQNGLSEHQGSLLRLFYDGKSDEDIRTEMGIGSDSTIRAHRFSLREKERQARIFIALMELLKEKHTEDKEAAQNLTVEQQEALLEDAVYKKFFAGGRLKTLDVREKNRRIILRHVIRKFAPDRIYTEAEADEILQQVFDDYQTLREQLVESGLLRKKPDGSQYWVSLGQGEPAAPEPGKKKEAAAPGRELKTLGGVYQIRNKVNGKVQVVSTPNLKTRYGRFLELQNGVYQNRKLQEDWNRYGENAFEFEVLETAEIRDESDLKDVLRRLEKKWLDKLQPFGDKGYNS